MARWSLGLGPTGCLHHRLADSSHSLGTLLGPWPKWGLSVSFAQWNISVLVGPGAVASLNGDLLSPTTTPPGPDGSWRGMRIPARQCSSLGVGSSPVASVWKFSVDSTLFRPWSWLGSYSHSGTCHQISRTPSLGAGIFLHLPSWEGVCARTITNRHGSWVRTC